MPPDRAPRVGDPMEGVDRVGYDADTARAVLPVAAALALFYVGLAALHHVVLDEETSHVMDVVALVSSLMAGTVALLAWRHPVADRWGHALMAGLIMLTTADATIHLAITQDPTETASFRLVIVGVGVALVRSRWFVVCVLLVWSAWIAGAVAAGGTARTWAVWAVYLAMASALACVVVVLRRRSIDVAAASLRRAVLAANTDPATGLANRRGLALRTRQMIDVGSRRGKIVHCTFLTSTVSSSSTTGRATTPATV